MNYVDSIDHFLGKGKVSKAAIFDRGGKPLATSPDLKISDQEARAISACISIPVDLRRKTQFGLFIGKINYICFKVDNKTVIGVNKDKLFVAHHCDDVMIVAFVRVVLPEGRTSCLCEVWNFAEELKTKLDVSNFMQ